MKVNKEQRTGSEIGCTVVVISLRVWRDASGAQGRSVSIVRTLLQATADTELWLHLSESDLMPLATTTTVYGRVLRRCNEVQLEAGCRSRRRHCDEGDERPFTPALQSKHVGR